jgi:hypothetical protein
MFESHRRLTEALGGDAAALAVRSTPPVAVSGLTLAGVGLQDWVFILTAIYTVLLIVGVLPKAIRTVRGWFGG